MKAIIQSDFGEADVLTFADIDVPKISPGECLIKVECTSVNYADVKARRGKKGRGEFPLILGLDLVGVVVKTGEDSAFTVGDRVVAFARSGSYAEYAVANEKLVYKIPDHMSIEQAAAMPTISFLSYILLHEIAQVKKEDTIVVHSAAGGVGSILIQLANIAGVDKIIGTVGNLDKAEYVRVLGADNVYTYDTFTEKVLQETDNTGADVIFDSVAGDVSSKSLECLALYGTLVQFGNSSGKVGTFKTSDVHSSCRNVKGFSLGTTRKHYPERILPAAEQVVELFSSGKLTVPIARIYPLKEAAEAHRLMESRNYTGKILLKI